MSDLLNPDEDHETAVDDGDFPAGDYCLGCGSPHVWKAHRCADCYDDARRRSNRERMAAKRAQGNGLPSRGTK